MRRTVILRMLVAVSCAPLAACNEGPNRLYGSLAEIYRLDFDRVGIVRIEPFVVVEYIREMGPAESLGKVAKLSVNLTGLELRPNVDIDLTEAVGGGPRGVLQRVLQTTTELPIQRGTATFERLPVAGAEVAGRFRATLSDPAGRTFNGDFSATVVQP